MRPALASPHVVPLIDVLGDAGYAIPERVLMLNTYFTFLNGYLLAEVGTVPGHADVPEPEGLPALGSAFEAVPVEALRLATNFDRAVEILLAGLATVPRA